MCHLLTKNVFQRCGKEAQFGRHRLFSSENSKARISKSTPRRVYIVGTNPAYLVLFYHCLKFGDTVFYHPVSAKINIATEFSWKFLRSIGNTIAIRIWFNASVLVTKDR